MAFSVDDLAAQLVEVDAQIAEMVGSPTFTVGGFTVDETTLLENMYKRKADLEWRINAMNAGAASGSNMVGRSGSGGY